MRAPAESTKYTSGIYRRSAVSWMRTIFSTVCAPHEPAFTVGSFAMTAHGRPCSTPIPVTTPSAERSGSALAASRPSSTNSEARSKSSAMRSRTMSLPCSATLRRCRSGPPARARWSRVATSPPAAAGAGASSRAASANAPLRSVIDDLRSGPYTGTVQPARQRLAEITLERGGHVAERGEIGSGGRAERGQRQQRVLAADVAGGPRRERASPNTTDGAVETPHTGLVGSHHVGNTDPARVVHVQ